MKDRYDAIVGITSDAKYSSIVFGSVFNYIYKRSNYFRVFNKLITIRLYKLKIRPICLLSTPKINYIKCIEELNNERHVTKKYIKENSTLSISLFKYLFAINITNYKDYNICRVNKELDKVMLE